MDKTSMLRRAVFTSGIEPSKAADLYERIIEFLEERTFWYCLFCALAGFFAGLIWGAIFWLNH